jgi:flavin-dependent dehydrogenase
VLVSRNHFDRVLADKAVEGGVQFQEGEKVVDIRETNDTVTVITDKKSYEARFLIGADGIHSRVAGSVRPSFRKDEIVLASVCNSRADDDVINRRLQDIITLHFGIAPLGYGWLFPHRGYFSLGMAGLASEFSEPRKTLSEYGRSLQVEPEAIRGHFIPLGGIKRKISSPRILLAGDAAGFADPFHGEGIAYAIISGKLAAAAIIDSLQNRREPGYAASRYNRECERLIRKQLRIALYMARALDRFPELLVRIFFDNTKAIEQYMEIASGRSDYQRFLRWLAVRIPFYLLSSFFKGFRRPRQVR